jgi:hypothetical protein
MSRKSSSKTLAAAPVINPLEGEWSGFEANLVWAKAKFSPVKRRPRRSGFGSWLAAA